MSTMPPGAFELLLTRLHRDSDRAAEEYEHLRARLIRFFEWNQCRAPDIKADDTLDRLAARLVRGAPIDNVAAFTIGIARHVLHDDRSGDAPLAGTLDHVAAEDPRRVEAEEEAAAAHLLRLEKQRRCLEQLPVADRRLIVIYHQGRGRDRITRRQHLARELGIGMNALRIRAHRIRRWLVECAGTVAGTPPALSS